MCAAPWRAQWSGLAELLGRKPCLDWSTRPYKPARTGPLERHSFALSLCLEEGHTVQFPGAPFQLAVREKNGSRPAHKRPLCEHSGNITLCDAPKVRSVGWGVSKIETQFRPEEDE